MQLVLRGHKTKREADYGSKKIGSFTVEERKDRTTELEGQKAFHKTLLDNSARLAQELSS